MSLKNYIFLRLNLDFENDIKGLEKMSYFWLMLEDFLYYFGIYLLLSAVLGFSMLYLNKLRLGLINGYLQSLSSILFWLVTAAFAVVQMFSFFFLPGMGPSSILFVFFVWALWVVVWFYFLYRLFSDLKTTHLADSINKTRLTSNTITEQLVEIIKNEKPEKAVVYADGIVLGTKDFKEFSSNDDLVEKKRNKKASFFDTDNVTEPDTEIPLSMSKREGVKRIIRFSDYGYGLMDDNSKRTFADIVKDETGEYQATEVKRTHAVRVHHSGDGSPMTGSVDSSGNVTIYGGSDSYDYWETDTKFDGYSYILTRKDKIQPIEEKSTKEEETIKIDKQFLKKW